MTDDSLNDVTPLNIAQQEMDKAAREFNEAASKAEFVLVDHSKQRYRIGYLCDMHHVDGVCPNCNPVKPADSVGKLNVYEKEVWNAAIEAAANVAEINSAANIRKLMK